jgi:hypothetical protein
MKTMTTYQPKNSIRKGLRKLGMLSCQDLTTI